MRPFVLSMAALHSACGAPRDKLDDDQDGSTPGEHAGMSLTNIDGGTGSGPNAQGGAGSDGGASNDLPGSDTVCADFVIPAHTQTPEVLVVLDRSGSMKTPFVNRWDPSIAAVRSLVSSLEPSIQFGLMTFPGDCSTLASSADQLACIARLGSFDASLSCEPGHVDVAVGSANTAPIDAALQATFPNGATPTAASITAAADAMTAVPTFVGEGTKSILLVTDGAPNCSLGVGGLLAVGLGSSNGQLEAVSQTVSAIERADSLGVHTYVIGYETDNDPFLTSSLDQMAQAGGTGETQHRRVEDQASLVQVFQDLTQTALLCQLKLDQPVTDPTRLRVVMDHQPVPSDPVNGYTLGTDQRTVSLRGTSCDQLRTSNGALVAHAQLLCPPSPPSGPGTLDGGLGWFPLI